MGKARRTGVKKANVKVLDPMTVDFDAIQYKQKVEQRVKVPEEEFELQPFTDLSHLKKDKSISSLEHAKNSQSKRFNLYRERIREELSKDSNRPITSQIGAWFFNTRYTHIAELVVMNEPSPSSIESRIEDDYQFSSQVIAVQSQEISKDTCIVEKKQNGLTLDQIVIQGFSPDHYSYLSMDSTIRFNNDGTRKPLPSYLCQPTGQVLLSMHGPNMYKVDDKKNPIKLGLFHLQIVKVSNYLGETGKLLYCMTRRRGDSPLKESICIMRDTITNKLKAIQSVNDMSVVSITGGSQTWLFQFKNAANAKEFIDFF